MRQTGAAPGGRGPGGCQAELGGGAQHVANPKQAGNGMTGQAHTQRARAVSRALLVLPAGKTCRPTARAGQPDRAGCRAGGRAGQGERSEGWVWVGGRPAPQQDARPAISTGAVATIGSCSASPACATRVCGRRSARARAPAAGRACRRPCQQTCVRPGCRAARRAAAPPPPPAAPAPRPGCCSPRCAAGAAAPQTALAGARWRVAGWRLQLLLLPPQFPSALA